LQWLQDQSEINGCYLNNVRQEASRHSRNKEREYLKDKINQIFIDFKKANDSVRREVLYSTLIVFGVPMKLVRLINMCLNETYSKVRIGKYLKQRNALSLLLFNFALECAIRWSKNTRWDWN
jgi:hypothetical protein